jgi:malic enzyme
MRHFVKKTSGAGKPYLEVNLRGADLLHNPILNKGTAFTEIERRKFGLTGLLPPHVSTIEEQIGRVYENFAAKENNIEKYVYLRSLQDRNETLFYALLRRNAEEMIPVIYTPTVGDAVRQGSHIHRHSRGLYISPENVEMMEMMAANLDSENIRAIVATDNQGILGIGDQGIGGMGIPIGKLSLYVLGAGIDPAQCLPVCLDVGTDNEALLDDPLYLGVKRHRLAGEEYPRFIGRFVEKIKKLYPGALLQWEDFSKQNAFTNLDLYRSYILSFNDDVQGTGAMAMAGIITALRIKEERLEDQRFLVYGAGAGGIGIARQIQNSLIAGGMDKKEALGLIYTVDSRGLILAGRAGLEEYKLDFAKNPAGVADWNVRDRTRITLLETIENSGATILFGASGQPGAFTRQVVEAMATNTPAPVIFPLSNPTSKAEATPADVIAWSGGGALVATGSPFGDVDYGGVRRRIGQGNNVFIFPGMGLGALASGAKHITAEMFTAASMRLADMAPPDVRNSLLLYPRVSELDKVTRQVALAVFQTAVKQGVATAPAGVDPQARIASMVWEPEYLTYEPGA